MQQYNGYKAERQTAREILPAGGYICKILDAKEIEYSWGKVIAISFDVVEGEHKDFYENDYANNTNEDKKWRGVYRLAEPKDDGSEKDGWTKNTFNGAMWALEQSNPGYHWDWNETALKGKLVGVLMRNKEWEHEGKTGWTTEAGMLESIDNVRAGTFKPLKDKPLKAKSGANNGFSAINDLEAELPF